MLGHEPTLLQSTTSRIDEVNKDRTRGRVMHNTPKRQDGTDVRVPRRFAVSRVPGLKASPVQDGDAGKGRAPARTSSSSGMSSRV